MTKISHTQGPWSVGYLGSDIVCPNEKIGGHTKLFDVRGWGYLTGKGHGALGLGPDEAAAIQKANAHLAAAAPDLLDAVYAALPFVEDALKDPAYKAGAVASHLKQMHAAIAKAEGTEPQSQKQGEK